MLRTFGATLAAATLALAGWAGMATAAPGQQASAPAMTPAPSPTPTYACPPALPVTGRVVGATPTTITIEYHMTMRPPCGYDPPMIVSLFTSLADAQQWRNPVAETVTGSERYGTVTIGGLTPETDYWFRFSDTTGKRDSYLIGGPGRTVGPFTCDATVRYDDNWGSGFVATVTVRNTGTESLTGWRTTWRWLVDERIQAVWGGVVESRGPDAAVRSAAHNGALAPGESTTFGLIASTSQPTPGFAPTCSRL